jgi:acyl-CoA synthetase (NDP forming)
MIIEGPNCTGMVNYIDATPLTFVRTDIPHRVNANRIAILSQSGAIAAVLGIGLHNRDLDISFSVATGNEAASCVEDFLEYMTDEPNTSLIILIVEQFRQPKRFLELVRRARAAGKSIVLLHPGRSSAARASAQTHTGALAGDYLVMKTKVEHAGVLLVDTIEEVIDVADILIRCKSLPERGAAVYTESGAFKALTLDFAESYGLDLPPLDDSTAIALRAALPDFILPSNPLDLTAQGLTDPDIYRRTLPLVLNDPNYGSVILTIILTDEGTSSAKFPPILDAIDTIRPNKPILFVAMDEGAKFDLRYVDRLRELGVPFFPSPDRAFRAITKITAYAKKLARTGSQNSGYSEDTSLRRGVLPEYESKQILKQLGVNIPAGGLATSLPQAQEIATEIGFPVVLKAQSCALSHKSDAGGVALNVKSAEHLDAEWNTIHRQVKLAIPGIVLDGILVEKMESPGVELIIGARNDRDWGPILLVGFGGVLAEAIHDVRLLSPELSEAAIREELYLLKSSALLQGFRGSDPLDVGEVAGIVARLGSLVLARPEIQEVDINPVVVHSKGAIALDAVIVVGDGG